MATPETVEALVVLAQGRSPASGRGWDDLQVTQQLRPRLMLVRGPRSALRDLAGTDAVSQVLFRGEDPPPTLDERERLFATAWLTTGGPRHRLRDGEPWDAPGASPPDMPPGRNTEDPPR